MFETSLRLLHTVRHLRPVQVYGRLWFRFISPRPDLSPPPHIRTPSGSWIASIAKPQSMMGPCSFMLLNEAGTVACRAAWNDNARTKLWLYNLHYFDDLTAKGSEQRTAWHDGLFSRWLNENPPAIGTGWEPYPTALRTVNWIKWQLQGNVLSTAALHSLAIQARWLRRRLEHHLLGNHLLANVKALLFASLFFRGSEAESWRTVASALLARELKEQILADGGHFERSPMYHAIVLEDLLDLVNLARVFPGVTGLEVVHDWEHTIQRMRRWLNVMTHPDCAIPFFNDSAFGVAADQSGLESYAQRLGLPPIPGPADGVISLADSGYIRVQGSADYVALLDVAPVGADHASGHAHADTLSFELSLWRKRVIVNSGTSVYGEGLERLRQRETVAHSTVEVNGRSSTEVWGGFRVARRAHPMDLRIEKKGDRLEISCAHDGYHRLPGRPTHRREWILESRSLTVRDSVTGRYQAAQARFYLHPEVKVVDRGNQGDMILPGDRRVAWAVTGGAASISESTWHPAFGLSLPNRCIEVLFSNGKTSMELRW